MRKDSPLEKPLEAASEEALERLSADAAPVAQQTNHSESPAAPPITVKGMLLGAEMVAPILPGVILFAMAVGSVCASKGFSLIELLLMNFFVYAGMSQSVALGIWQNEWSWSALLGLAIVTATVNSRLFLMGASLQPWFGATPAWKSYTSLLSLTDANWLVAQRYRAEGGQDIGVFIGAGVVLWVVWTITAIPGYYLGQAIVSNKYIAMELFVPLFFTAMVTPLWKGARETCAWGGAGISAFLAERYIGGSSYIIIGAIVGMLIAAFWEDKSGGQSAAVVKT